MDNTHPLLVPRWKVINDYPEPHNHPYYEVGYIIQAITNEDVQYLSKYPALFEPLPWYADRKAEDMPEYIRFKQDGAVFKIEHWDMKILFGFVDLKNRRGCGLTTFKPEYGYDPATEADYLTYKSSTEGKGGEV